MSSLDRYTKSRFAQLCYLVGVSIDIVNWYDCKEIATIEFQQQNQVKGKGKKVVQKVLPFQNDWKLELSDKIQEAGNKELASFFTLLVGLTG